jgi:glycosyltransferase involved in cell wall biosynthesis
MKILLSNKFYYPRGGSDIYMIELEKLLKSKGHEVAVFAMQHQMNLHNKYSEYFPPEVDMNNRRITSLLPTLVRPFGSPDVIDKFRLLLRQFKPDLVHLNNIHSQLSPILTVLARNHNVPVVWTLHDHKLLCPRYDCMRQNKPCELCFTNKINVLRYKCMKNSLLASMVAFTEAIIWNRKKVSKSTNIFICPSFFLSRNMIKGRFREHQIITLPNFVGTDKFPDISVKKQDYYCYVGRLSAEKGIETLLKAAKELPEFKLKVIGTGPLESELKAEFEGGNIQFMGFKKWEELKFLLGNALFMTIPSICYENNPLSVIESLCLGTPVLGANIGGIPELIEPGINGMVFEAGNVSDLKKKIVDLFHTSGQFNYAGIATAARRNFSSEGYYEKIMDIYKKAIA